jgi:GNAT superfamily N-acetyltransferase
MIDRDRLLELQRRGLRDWIAAMGSASAGARLFERDGVAAAVVPACPDRSVANSVSSSDPAALAGLLDELADAYERAGVQAWTVWVPEFDSETIAALEAAGHAFDGKPLAMALELEGWRAPEIGELDWDRDVDPALLGRLNDLAYGLEPEIGVARALADPLPEYTLYQARVEGRPACVLATIDHGDDLGFYFVATDPGLRGRGLASRLMAVALADAQRRGIATSTLQSSALGQPVYERLGFAGGFRLHMYERRAGRSGRG